MSVYQALYRKWRPMRFDDIVGQKQVSDTLKTAVANGRTSHAYLFCGTRGTGKTSTAKIFSRAVNCESPIDGEPCNECPTCKGILDGSILDVYEMDAASNRGVENIREIRDEVIYTPVGCKYKVYIIDEVHMLTAEAFNALLKTLEEPPHHAIFILATTEPHKIPATILSRCQRFDFKRISVDDIACRISKITSAEGINITTDAIETVAELGDGSMRDAISILDRCSVYGSEELTSDRIADIMGVVGPSKLFEICDAVSENNAKLAVKLADEILREGKEAQNLIENLIDHYRILLACKTTDKPADLIEKTETAAEKFAAQSVKYGVERILYSIKTLGEYLAQAKWLSKPKLAVTQAVVRLSNPTYSSETEALLARIEKLEAKVMDLSLGIASAESVSVKKADDNTEKAEKAEEKKYDNKDNSKPPWDTSDGKTKLIATDEKTDVEVANKPEVEASAANNKTDNSAENTHTWNLWTEALGEIKKESKLLYAFLYNAGAVKNDTVIEIEVEGKLAYDRISTEDWIKYLSKMFSRVAGEPLTARVFIKNERQKSEKKEEKTGFSIQDIANKKDVFGDKIDII